MTKPLKKKNTGYKFQYKSDKKNTNKGVKDNFLCVLFCFVCFCNVQAGNAF